MKITDYEVLNVATQTPIVNAPEQGTDGGPVVGALNIVGLIMVIAQTAAYGYLFYLVVKLMFF